MKMSGIKTEFMEERTMEKCQIEHLLIYLYYCLSGDNMRYQMRKLWKGQLKNTMSINDKNEV